MNKDLYSILGVDKNTSDEEIKKRYRKLCLQFHPDKQNGKSDAEKKEAEEKFKEISEAYSVLSDPEKKKQYDMYGTVGEQPGFGGMDDAMAEFIRHMHNPFGGFGMGGFNPFEERGPENVVVNGTDIRVKIQCTLEEAYNGASKTIKYKRKAKCPDCGGSGSKTNEVEVCSKCHGTGRYRQVFQTGWESQIIDRQCDECNGTGKKIKNKCHKCSGSGLTEITETITLNVPNDVMSGNVVVKSGYGNDAPNNLGQSGNLIIMFVVKTNSIFGVAENGYDLYCKTEVGVLDCITGTETDIKCIDGTKVKMTVPKYTKENTKIVVKGKGMPKPNGTYGDMFVFVQQKMPTDLSKDEIKMLDELKKQKHFKK